MKIMHEYCANKKHKEKTKKKNKQANKKNKNKNNHGFLITYFT